MLTIKRFDVWLADLNPRFGTEPGKIRPVVIIQTNLLNEKHPSTLVCPVTSKLQPESNILRIALSQNEAGLKIKSNILVDQIRAIDNKRLQKRVGAINEDSRINLMQNLKIVLDLS